MARGGLPFRPAEALIIESRVRSPKAEVYRWRLSELTMGTYRVTLTFAANFGMLEKVSKSNAIKAQLATTLKRLKEYVEDKRSYAGPRTFVAQNPTSFDPLDN